MQIQEYINMWIEDQVGLSRVLINDLALNWLSIEYPELSSWEKAELAEKTILRIKRILGQNINESQHKGIPVLFCCDSTLDYATTIFRYDDPNWEPIDTIKSILKDKRRISKIPQIKSSLDKLDSQNSLAFELFNADLLNRMGYEIQVPTQRVKEGGVDFYGYKNKSSVLGNFKFRILGQSKRWNNKIDPKEAQHFIYQLSEFQQNRGQAYKILPEDFKSNKTPLYGLFCSSGYYTKDAAICFENYGVEFWDGFQLTWGIILHYDDWFDVEGNFLSEHFINYYNQKAQEFFNNKVIK